MLLSNIMHAASGVVDAILGAVPTQGLLIGILQMAGGKFIKKFTTDDVPNEIIIPFSMAVSMLGWMLVNSGAHPTFTLQQVAEASLWPAMKQFVVVTGVHSISKNSASLAKITAAGAVKMLAGTTWYGRLIALLPWVSKIAK